MCKIDMDICNELDEQTYTTKLKNGLDVFICKKKGFKKKIGMFGTKYGSINNDFFDISANKRVKVPDGIAHFLEHKLFEQEGANALDLFTRLGVSSNAYTSFDQTVFYFETTDKFKESIELLIKLVKTPYFTDANVQKEQGIIGQEIMMYDDDPSSVVYMNILKAMYNVTPINIDIAGTVESISKITKELLYTCYHTFYSPQNMFLIVVGDVEIDETIKEIENNLRIYEKDYDSSANKVKIEKYIEKEEQNINQKQIVKNMDIYMPQVCLGFKLEIQDGINNIKRDLASSIISDMYFSRISDFFEKEYGEGIITEPPEFVFEGGNSFAHVLILANSTEVERIKNDLVKYIDHIKSNDIDEELFELIKKKKIGDMILSADNLNSSYRRIIESTLENVSIYDDIKVLYSITSDNVKELLNSLKNEYMVVSIIDKK